ncbi:hypothetical protein BJF78_07825 [Pseudonocardia sp. CNS-139]|nr:hypothetical protein BJF78_07825 [Pseudonocardia sp. CNS-139]
MSELEERSGPLATGERAELERLRREVAELRAAPPAPPVPPEPPRRRGLGAVRWASVGSVVLLVLGLLLVPISVFAIWTNNQISDTDRFVATVGPVVEDPTVQAALANRITTEVFAQLDVQQIADQGIDALAAQGVPPQVVDRLRDLTGPLAEGARGFVQGRINALVASPAFVDAAQRALTVSHDQMVAVLSGQSSAITVEGGSAVLDLAPFIDAAKQQLVASGFAAAGRIPEIHPTIELFPASTLIRAQSAYRFLDAAATWLPWVTILALVGGVLLARRRRRATIVVGVGVMAVMVVLAAALLIARGVIVGGVTETAAAPAAAAYDILVRFLRAALRTLFVVGLLVALAAWVTGPSTSAVAIRRTLSRWIDALRRGRLAQRIQEGPVGPWVHRYRRVLRVAAVLLAALVVVLLDRPSGLDILLVAVVLLVVLAVIQFLDQPREQPAEPPAPSEPPAGGDGARPAPG